MVSNNKRRRKNNRNNKKNRIKKDKMDGQPAEPTEEQEPIDQELADEHETPLKRAHPEDVSDVEESEDKPKRKKKKKQPAPAPPSDKKGKKSIRQMKKEKHVQRQAEAQAAAKDQLKSECISYLSQWKHDKPNWKFMKAKQVWIYKNKFSSQLMPEDSWPTFLEYFESAQGNIRNMLLDDANKVIKQMDEWTEKQSSKVNDNENETEDITEEDSSKPDEISYKRARDLIQCLQE